MPDSTYLAFYKSDLQSVYALCVVPLLFLGYLLVSRAPRAAARSGEPWRQFLSAYCVVFAVESVLDCVATGPVTKWLGVGDTSLGTAIFLTFVLLGDFRVYLLTFRLAQVERPIGQILLQAAGWTFVVPVVAYSLDSALHYANPLLPEQTIWLIYELAFLGIAIWLRTRLIPRLVPDAGNVRRRGLEAAATYAATYYALWAAADVLILVLGLDFGWALRVVPNQLYYSFWLPFVFFQFSSRR